ncbi:MAG: hypothetical protein KA508_06495 [Gammaproteobacteria bacterium]|nr:hypothetical protein [Gammaproteobacteria bacterium]
MYEKGDDVVQDIDKALSWYQQSQATGNPEAAKKCEALRRASYGS